MIHSAPRLSVGAEALMPIKANLEAFSPGLTVALACVAGLRKASMLFKHSCTIYSCNTPTAGGVIHIHAEIPWTPP